MSEEEQVKLQEELKDIKNDLKKSLWDSQTQEEIIVEKNTEIKSMQADIKTLRDQNTDIKKKLLDKEDEYARKDKQYDSKQQLIDDMTNTIEQLNDNYESSSISISKANIESQQL